MPCAFRAEGWELRIDCRWVAVPRETATLRRASLVNDQLPRNSGEPLTRRGEHGGSLSASDECALVSFVARLTRPIAGGATSGQAGAACRFT